MEHAADPPANPGHVRDVAAQDLTVLYKEITRQSLEDAIGVVYREALWQARGDEPRAQDLAQMTWMKIVSMMRDGSFPELIDYPNAWLRQLVRRVTIDSHRESRAAKRNPGYQPQSLQEVAQALEPAAPGDGPEDLAIRSDLHQRLREAIAELPTDQREVVTLVMKGHSHPEIAKMLRIPVGTSKTRLRAATQHLRGVRALFSDGED